MEIKQKQRSEIPIQYKWNVTDLYPTINHWRKAIDELKTHTKELREFEGKLTTGEAILACLTKRCITDEVNDVVFLYAYLHKHTDNANPEVLAMADTVDGLESDYNEGAAFIEPEILALDETTLRSFISNTPGLEVYEHYFNNLLRKKAHIPSAEVAELLASASEMADASSNAYDMLAEVDIEFDNITDEDGNSAALTENNYYSTFTKSTDRRVRKDAYEAYFNAYLKQKNTHASLRVSCIEKDIFFAKARKYPSTLDASLHESNIPRAVYENLIATVNEFLPVFHRYNALRKKALMLDEYHVYDRYAPLVREADGKIPYEEAKKLLMEGLAPLGEEYLSILKNGIESGWVDVYESEGKSSGAWAWSEYGVHPFVLLNYGDNFESLSEFAHEMGHAMHSYYKHSTQPYIYEGHTTFTGEVASTVNDALMAKYMLKTATDPKSRIYLLDQHIEQFRGIVFHQTMYAEFEMETHRITEEGEPLTLEVFNKIWRELNIKYNGPDAVIAEQSDFGWVVIPHFFRAFYVYQYATGYSAAMALASRLQSGDSKMREDYLNFLKAGNSDYSIEILKKAGVDMSTPAPIREALKVFESLVDELERCIQLNLIS
ncbi:MAG: oligoendopeptidase F [Defluviitaleaceae bacterium]|nr:oligoendopeptidase F [Defluviitaleaceae bacterium]